ncbi:MAG: SDR family oxidoreductase [Candidatus Omnitrophica bacterium]|nr:SDR family oxidoreductase [Candidatus Omnitrophota bacterium]
MNGKTLSNAALVTGASQRIGKAIALALADRGFDIALHYNKSKQEALVLAAEIKQKGGACELFSCDLGKESAVLRLLESVHKRFPQLSLLVNNASIFEPSQLGRDGLQALDEHWQINFRAPYVLLGEFARLCSRGHVINILDTKVSQNKTDYVGYLLSKKCLAELTKIAALKLAPTIRVNGISPGIILAPSHKGQDYLTKRARDIPLQRSGDVKFITQSVGFLLDNEFVTGQILFVDGGEHLLGSGVLS